MDEFTQNTDPRELGEYIARIYRWNGAAITNAFLEALTEANFYQLRDQLAPIIRNHLEG